MKLIVYILSALLLISSISAGGTSSKQEISISEIEKDSNLKDALKYGINWIFQQAADKYGTSPANIEVTQVNSIYRWTQNKDTYYSFDVEATNNNDAWINGTYTVRCNSAGEKVTKWKYHIEWNDNGKDNECEVPDAGENVEIDVEVDVETTPEEDCETPEEGQAVEVEVEHDTEVEIEVEVVEEEDNNKCKEVAVSEVDNDSELKKALVYGINWIYQQAADKYGTSASNVEVTKINSICKWKEDSNTYYTFTVESTNNNDAWINGTYTVRCNSSGEKVVKWKYHIEWKDNGKSDEEECETPNGGQEVEVEVEHDTEVEVEGNSECEEENTGTNVEVEVEHDVEVEVEQPNDGYYELSNSDCEDEQIRDIIDEAIDYVTCRETEKIPKDDYYLKKIVSAYKKETSNADYYKFEVDVENKDGSTEIDLKFTSEVQGTTYKVKAYWFHIST